MCDSMPPGCGKKKSLTMAMLYVWRAIVASCPAPSRGGQGQVFCRRGERGGDPSLRRRLPGIRASPSHCECRLCWLHWTSVVTLAALHKGWRQLAGGIVEGLIGDLIDVGRRAAKNALEEKPMAYRAD